MSTTRVIKNNSYSRKDCTDGSWKVAFGWWLESVVPVLVKLFDAKKPGNLSFLAVAFLKRILK